MFLLSVRLLKNIISRLCDLAFSSVLLIYLVFMDRCISLSSRRLYVTVCHRPAVGASLSFNFSFQKWCKPRTITFYYKNFTEHRGL